MRFNPNTGEFEPENSSVNRRTPPPLPPTNGSNSWGYFWIILVIGFVGYFIFAPSKKSNESYSNESTPTVDSLSVSVADTVAATVGDSASTAEVIDSSTVLTVLDSTSVASIVDTTSNLTTEKIHIRNALNQEVYYSISCISNDNFLAKSIASNQTNEWFCEGSDVLYIKIMTNQITKDYVLKRGKYYKIDYQNGVFDIFNDD